MFDPSGPRNTTTISEQLARAGDGPHAASLRSVVAQLMEDPETYITHLYVAPPATAEAIAKASAASLELFGCGLPSALAAFYADMNGLELRSVRPLHAVPREQWNCVDSPEIIAQLALVSTMSELLARPDAMQLGDTALLELASLAGIRNLTDKETIFGRHTDANATGTSFYNNQELRPNTAATIIPPVEVLFDPSNMPDGQGLSFFDYFSDFNQMMIGAHDGELGLCQVRYGAGERMWIRETFGSYLKAAIKRHLQA